MPTLQTLLDSLLGPLQSAGSAHRSVRRRARLVLEPLERRAMLAVDFLGGDRVAQLAWQGELVDVQSDSWIVRSAAEPVAADLELAAGWQTEPLGEGFYALSAPGAGAADVLGWAATAGWVEYVEPDFMIRSSARPNDPLFSQLWGLANSGSLGGLAGADIAAPAAWDVTTGSREVVIAVIDTGVDYTHPDIAANMWRNPREIVDSGRDDDGNGFVDDIHGWNFVARNGRPLDDNGHGTHVAGTIGAVGNNGLGITGVSWQVSIMALKFLDANGSGTTANAIAAINYATRMRRDFGINIVATNNSWGGGGFSTGLRDAIAAGGRAGILFVAAAGNDGTDNDRLASYPASYPDPALIAVAATDRADRLAGFSNFGSSTVQVAAPGVGIVSTVPGGRYASYSGTSMAAPHVAGTLALMAAANPDASASELRSALLATTRPVGGLAGRVMTGGVINAGAAVQAVLPADVPPGDPAPLPEPTPEPDDPPAPAPEPPPPAIVDVGDTIRQAFRVAQTTGDVILPGIIGDGRFGSRDVDIYRVRVAAGQTLVVETFAQRLPGGSSLDTYLRVFDARGRQLGANDDHGGTLDSRLVIRARTTGWFFIGVSGFGNSRYNPTRAGSGRNGSTGSYELVLQFGPLPARRSPGRRSIQTLGFADPLQVVATAPRAEAAFAALASHLAALPQAAPPPPPAAGSRPRR
jgi:subtilisin family serine protease